MTENQRRKRDYRAKIKRLINAEKLSRGECIDCGLKVTVQNLVAFDFDHVERHNKKSGIADLRGSFGIPGVCEELAKCVLRCAICHRLKTFRDNDHLTQNLVLTLVDQPTLFELLK